MQAYQSNRFVTLMIVLFFAVQLLNNIRQDIAISPWYSYGMFSEPVRSDTGVRVVTIRVNDHLLNPVDFMPQGWDRITQPLLLYNRQHEWNAFLLDTDIKRLLPFSDEKNFTNNISRQAFITWYHEYMEKIVNEDIKYLQAEVASYSLVHGALQKTAVIDSFEMNNP